MIRFTLAALGGLALVGSALAGPANEDARPETSPVEIVKVDPDFAALAGKLNVKSHHALVVELGAGQAFYAKNTDAVVPIASITKLMTAMVVLDSQLPLDEPVKITRDDIDRLKGTSSRLPIGSMVSRGDLLLLALMSSENRAASAVARAYPGGTAAFVAAMNEKALSLSMRNTRFVDSTGLSSGNVSTAADLARLVRAAYSYPEIRQYTTEVSHTVNIGRGRRLQYSNSNRLVQSPNWEIGLSKTGYISEAGRCLVMQAVIAAQPVIIVLLDSWGRLTRIGDANRIKKWMESSMEARVAARPES